MIHPIYLERLTKISSFTWRVCGN